MAFSTGSTSGPSSEINITPLIDVLLVLLIIFMVLVPMMPKGLESAVPQDKSISSAAQPTLVEVRAGAASGETLYRVNRSDISREEIRPRLQAILAARLERTVILEADQSLTYGPVAWVAGEATRAGASAIMLAKTDGRQ